MTTFTSTQAQNACDNLGKLVIDAAALLPSSTATLTTDLATEITRIQALTDQLANPTLGAGWNIETLTAANQGTPASKMLTWVANLNYAALINSNGPWYALDALDYLADQISTYTGLSDFLVGLAVTVDVYFADTYNAWCLAVASGAYVRRWGTNTTPKVIPATQVFVHTNVDDIQHWTASGATTGTLVAGAGVLAKLTGGNTVPGGGVLEAYAGGTIGAASYTITATYNKLDGTGTATVTFTIPSATTVNTVFTPGGTVNAASIVSIAVTTGSATAADIIKFRVKPVRSITA